MDYREARILIEYTILPQISNGFLELFPDTFVKCNTLDSKIYNEANGCMYRWYMATINGINRMNFSPKYSQTRQEMINNDHSCVKRFADDLLTTDNFLGFIVENVMIDF
jgi:hypothetical protein